MGNLVEHSADTLLEELELDFSQPAGNYLCCYQCITPITSDDQAISINQQHSFCFTNPGGFRFHIGCFKSACGCSISGPFEDAHSWFPGYYWQFASCEHCGEHLGWYYQSSSSLLTRNKEFFGLISIKLIAVNRC